MKIERLAFARLKQFIAPGVVTIVYGPRRVGKTTLIQQLITELPERDVMQFTGDSAVDRDRLAFHDQRHLKDLLGSATHIFIDEAQRIPNIGLTLKLIVDWLPDKQVIATGSATFALARQTEEPLTGRKRTLTLYPISYPELITSRGKLEAKLALERWLIWGSYPKAVTIDRANDRKLWLEELVNGYLYKDILELSGIRHAGKLVDLLRLLAYQIGGQVSVSELGAQLGMTKETVAHYLDLLVQSFVLVQVRGLSRNLRKEITKTNRYYFWDTGIRNILINNVNDLKLRDDVDQLWENFMVTERLKLMANTGAGKNYYFWRTHDQKEIDWVEEEGGLFHGYEFKFSDGKMKATTRALFLEAYPGSALHVVNKDNFDDTL